MSDPGREMYELMERLYPICRSLTGDGVRETLDLIEEQIPLERTEIGRASCRERVSLTV